MKKTILFLLIISGLPLIAQENKFYIGIYGSPDISEAVALQGSFKSGYNELVKIRMAYTFGITAGLRINKNLSFESGIQFSIHGSQTGKVPFVFVGPEPDPDLEGFTHFKGIFSYGFLGIPLRMRYTGNSGKFYFTSSAGLIPNYAIINYTRNILYGEERTVKKTYSGFDRRMTVTALVTAGMGRRFSERIGLILEPAFQYDLISPAKGSDIHHWNLGLRMGLTVDL